MPGFDLRISGVGRDRFANCATTTAHSSKKCSTVIATVAVLNANIVAKPVHLQYLWSFHKFVLEALCKQAIVILRRD